MKVILEAQHAVGREDIRGIGHCSLNLIKALLERRKNEYELTFFDYTREMENYKRAEEYFSSYNVPMHECNTLDYRVASANDDVFDNTSYNEYTGTNGDIFHFLCHISIPTNLSGKMVTTVHDLFGPYLPEYSKRSTLPYHIKGLERLKTIKPFIIAVSEYTKKQIIELTKINEDQIFVIYIGYDELNLYYDCGDDWNDQKSKLGINEDYFLYLSALDPNKNIPRIIDAFSIVTKKHTDMQLVLSGRNYFDDTAPIYDAIEKSGCKDRIILTGYVDNNTKRHLYSNALCFVFPSISEGFGIPPLEAMACGCPVITSNTTALPEVVGDAGILIDPTSVEQLAFEMDRVAVSETLRSELREKGLQHCKLFSWEKAAEQTEEVYMKLASL